MSTRHGRTASAHRPGAVDVARRRARMADHAGSRIGRRLRYAARFAGGLAVLGGRRFGPGVGLVAAKKGVPKAVALAGWIGKAVMKLGMGAKAVTSLASGVGVVVLAALAWFRIGRGRRTRGAPLAGEGEA